MAVIAAGDEHRAQLETDGFVVLAGAIEGAALADAQAAASTLLAAEPLSDNDFDGRLTRRCYGLLGKTRAFDSLLTNSDVQALVAARLDGPFQFGMLFLTAPGPGQGAQVAHRDATVYPLGRDRELEVNSLWALSDFTPENGATLVVPGSHRWDAGRRPEADEWRPVTMAAGSVCVYSGWLLHRAGANTTQTARPALIAEHVLAWLRPADNHSLTTPVDVLAHLGPQLSSLAGVAAAGPFLGLVAGQDPQQWLAQRA